MIAGVTSLGTTAWACQIRHQGLIKTCVLQPESQAMCELARMFNVAVLRRDLQVAKSNEQVLKHI